MRSRISCWQRSHSCKAWEGDKGTAGGNAEPLGGPCHPLLQLSAVLPTGKRFHFTSQWQRPSCPATQTRRTILLYVPLTQRAPSPYLRAHRAVWALSRAAAEVRLGHSRRGVAPVRQRSDCAGSMKAPPASTLRCYRDATHAGARLTSPLPPASLQARTHPGSLQRHAMGSRRQLSLEGTRALAWYWTGGIRGTGSTARLAKHVLSKQEGEQCRLLTRGSAPPGVGALRACWAALQGTQHLHGAENTPGGQRT